MKNNKKEIVKIEIPSKAIRVQHASCPRGHSLMDPEHKINGYPSVTVLVRYQEKEGLIHLDPVYGSFKNVPEIEVEKDAVVGFFCPTCHVSLSDEGQVCSVCASPMFAIYLPHGGIVEGCLRNGCQFHNLKVSDGGELLKRLYEDHSLDSFL
jgi:hypothetical protein